MNKEEFLIIDKNIKSKWLNWESFFSKGLDIEKANEFHELRYFKKIRLFFSDSDISCFDSILKDDNFNYDIIYDLKQKAISTDINIFLLFIDEFNEIKSFKNHNIEYWIKRGWNLEESKGLLKDFFKKGQLSIKEKRKDFTYNMEFCETRKPGALASSLVNRNNESLVELEIKKILKNNHLVEDFYSPVINEELKQLYNKKNFLHDAFIDKKYILEYNGIYWHKDFTKFKQFSKKDYMFEIKKAYNCLYEVKRNIDIKYIIIWENDFSTTDDIICFIENCLNNNSLDFFSSRDIDYGFFDEYVSYKKNEEKNKKLFSQIVDIYAKESHCESKKVAAIAVKNGRIIATGINGTPSGYINCDDYFHNLHISLGISIPYNEWVLTDEWRELHHNWSNEHEIHAEQSLICESAKNGIQLEDIDIYTSMQPCIHCSKILAALKPNKIYFVHDYDKSSANSKFLLNSCGIVLEKISSEE